MISKQPSAYAPITPLDIGIVGAGVLAFVFSFISYYTVTVSGSTRTTGAWHGFYGWFAAVVALLGALVLVAAFVSPGQRWSPPYRVVLVVFTIATLSVVAALFTSGFGTSRVHALGVAADTGHGYGYWTSLVAIIAGTAMSLGRVVQEGGQLPGPLRRLSRLGSANREG